jgi:hypothetical protein
MRNKIVPAVAFLFTFALISALMMKILPDPLQEFDYMLIGTVATLVSMLVLFLTLVGPRLKSGDVFVKRRNKR